MSYLFEYIEGQIDTAILRRFAQLDDEALKFLMASWICNITSGLKCSEIPTKAPKMELAKRMIKSGKEKKEVLRVSGISERHFYRLKKEIDNG